MYKNPCFPNLDICQLFNGRTACQILPVPKGRHTNRTSGSGYLIVIAAQSKDDAKKAFSMKCGAFSLQCGVGSVQSAMFSSQVVVSCVQCVVCSGWCEVCSIKCSLLGVGVQAVQWGPDSTPGSLYWKVHNSRNCFMLFSAKCKVFSIVYGVHHLV